LDKKQESQNKIDDQIQDFVQRNPHFATPGARRYVRSVWIGYAVLAIATVIGIWAFTNRADKHLRRDIAHTDQIGCLASIKIFHKYNDLIDSIIVTRREQYKLAIKNHQPANAKIQLEAIKRYESDKIVPPTPIDCKKAGIRR
jgi:hypothetical protein